MAGAPQSGERDMIAAKPIDSTVRDAFGKSYSN
jgi:hypothetical protein